MIQPAAAPSGTTDARNSRAKPLDQPRGRRDRGRAGRDRRRFLREATASAIGIVNLNGDTVRLTAAIGTAGSLAANVATAGPGIISRVIAGWPALALLIAVKLLSGILDRHATMPSGTLGESRDGQEIASRPAVPRPSRPAGTPSMSPAALERISRSRRPLLRATRVPRGRSRPRERDQY
jgi:hypothetical protein